MQTPNTQRSTPNVKAGCIRGLPRRSNLRRRVGCSTFDACHPGAFGVGGFGVFFSPEGRVAESGLRHSTRNRAWGNPPWVRIPPLPPSFVMHRNLHLRITYGHDEIL